MASTKSAYRLATNALGRFPLLPVALKAAVAAALAWIVVQPLHGAADDYSYYAPLGAVVAVSSRLAQSMRASVETILAIGLGACLALGARAAPVPEVLSIGLVVGVGTLVGAWKRVGSMASWVPIPALFILIVGGSDPAPYVLSYLGLTALGAAVGVVVNVVAPPLPLVATEHVQDALREVLADQLDGLADGLERDPLPTTDEWQTGVTRLQQRNQRAQELMGQTLDTPRMNWRVRRRREATERQRRQGEALTHLTFLVQEMMTLLSHAEHADRSLVALGPELRPSAARAFRKSAAALRSVEASVADEKALDEALRAADELALAIRRQQDDQSGETFAAGGLVTAIRRVLASVTPEELASLGR
ncbi:hypothetical protein [Nocardioides sp. Root140]|uniref:hypothetical protein n=1 Tax=Nocardioides sp. Root140 TaxID=1736460 RepID=UPI000A7DCCB4|nr:hypothetical protein [Nocardioides sp. Root140]